MAEQWQEDWMHDTETGAIVDGPTMTREEMFLEIRRLRAEVKELQGYLRDAHRLREARAEAAARAEDN